MNDNWYNTITFTGDNTRLTQIAYDVFRHTGEFYIRVQHDSNVYDWHAFYPSSKFGEPATIYADAITNYYKPGLYRCDNCGVMGLTSETNTGFWGYCILFVSDTSPGPERYWVVFQNQALSKIHLICNYNITEFSYRTINIDDIAYNSVINPQIAGKAPKSHASTSTEYGAAASNYYGHVKISSAYKANAGSDTALSSYGANAMYNEFNNKLNNYLDDDRWFRTYSIPEDVTDFSIRSTNKNFGEWILLVNVGHHAVIISCMVSRLSASFSTSYTFYKTLVSPSDVIISGVQGMIESGDHVLIRVFLSSRWQNGYGCSVRVLNRAGAISSVSNA